MNTEPPASVQLVMSFVNTAEPQLGTDQLTPPHATASLQDLDLIPPGVAVDAGDIPLLVGLREGIRRILFANAGHNDEPETDAAENSGLDALLGSVPLTLSLTHGHVTLSAVQDRAAHQAIAAVLSAVVASSPEAWARLKVCARDSCRWAFYDTSRNRSGRWCSMAGCGNIVKMRRAYRTRKHGSGSV